MKKYRFEIILFIVEAVCMILELVASRVLAPYFGTSNLVWTSVIGIILLSGSIGNYFGGIVADKPEVNRKFKNILILSALMIIIIPFIQTTVIEFIDMLFSDIRIGAILATIVLFFIPSLFLGYLVPIVQKLKIENLETCGQVSGKVYAIATIGGIVGTFLGGFWLVPNFGSVQILFVLAIVLLWMIPLVEEKNNFKEIAVILISTIVLIAIMNLYSLSNEVFGDDVLNGEIGNYVSYDTQYGRVIIYNDEQKGQLIRHLNIDSGYESATFVDEKQKYDLVYEYTKYYDWMFNSDKEINNTLMIGGAGYSYPKYYINKYSNRNMDVVEIDGEITNIAKKYFYLDDLIKEHKLEENKRLNLITDDGRTYLNNNTKKYDAILNDAFSGSSPAETLTTLEAVSAIKNSLTENGLYLTNIISSLEGENSKFIKSEVKTLKEVFLNVYIIPCNTLEDLYLTQNNMVVATDGKLDIDEARLYNLTIDDNDIVITDDYCPIDKLNPKR